MCVFSFEAAYDEKGGSVLADSLQVGGKKLAGRRRPIRTPSSITFPGAVRARAAAARQPADPAAAQARGARCKAGTFASAWGLGTPPAEHRRARPVRARRVRARAAARVRAQSALLRARTPTATPLPYLDRVVVEIVPDQNAELLRLEAGQLDMTASEIAPEDYAPLKRAADDGRREAARSRRRASMPTASGST